MEPVLPRDYRDLLGGLILMVVGVSVALYATANYPLGTVSRMGPGMFPTALGYLLAGLGAMIALPAWARSGTLPRPEWGPLLYVLVAVLIFALTVERIGLVPAIFLLTGASVLADNKVSFLGTLMLAAFLSVLAVLIFQMGLGIPVYPFVWPF
jgi:hypothetical protein